MSKMEIFDPAMCCSTGVCGPSVDKNLLRVATVISAIIKKGGEVKRYNLSSDPQAFVDNKVINEYLMKEGVDILPITLLDGEVIKTKEYLTNEEFYKVLNLKEEPLTLNLNKGNSCCCNNDGCC